MSTEICVPVSPLLEVDACHAARVTRWIVHCGGVAVWGCLDLATPSRQWFTPARLTDGAPSRPPHWSAPEQPQRIITDTGAVEVVERREVCRFHVAVRPGYGVSRRLTAASSRRLNAALETAGDGATHLFEGDEAVVFAVVRRLPLARWQEEHPDAQP